MDRPSVNNDSASLICAFKDIVRQYPQRPAIIDGQASYSYQELDALSDRVAYFLKAQGVQRGDAVAICLPRGWELPTIILGVLKLSAVYVPLDRAAPQVRVKGMLEDAKVQYLIADTELSFKSVTSIMLRDVFSGLAPSSDLALESLPYELACIYFTSGSTGRPKAVEVFEDAIIARNLNPHDLHLTPGRRVAHLANPAFDASTYEIWAPLLNGATIVVFNNDEVQDLEHFGQRLRERKIDHIFLTTGLFNLVVSRTPQAFSEVSVVLFGGEAASPRVLEHYFKNNPGSRCRVFNIYGPTECTTFSLIYEVRPSAIPALIERNNVPIGQPIAHTQVFVVVDDVRLAGPDEVGELCIAGRGLARGYRNDPVQTKAKFRTYEWLDSGLKMYKTGDLVKRNAEGQIEFVGRADRQVKVRGFRIELSEIEKALLAHEHLHQAVVLVQEINEDHADRLSGDKRLVAFYEAHTAISSDELRTFLLKTLPSYMVPHALECVERMPLNANGKVDSIKLLESLDSRHRSAGPAKARERISDNDITRILSSVLGPGWDADKSFIAAGGDSLKAMLVISMIRETTGLPRTVGALLESSSIAKFLDDCRIEIGPTASAQADPHPEDTDVSRYLANPEQQRIYFLQSMCPDSTAYHVVARFKIEGELDPNRLEKAFYATIQKHPALRSSVDEEDGEIIVKVQDRVPIQTKYFEVLFLKQGPTLEEIEAQCFAKPFDLSCAGLIRAVIVQDHPRLHYFFLCLHHIAADGWSLDIILKDISQFYELGDNTPQSERVNSRSPKSFDDARALFRRSPQFLEQKRYWKHEVDQVLQGHFLTQFPNDRVTDTQGQSYVCSLTPKEWAEIQTWCRQKEVTPFIYLCAILAMTLRAIFQRSDISIGVATANRSANPSMNTVGMFVNTLPLFLWLNAKKAFEDTLEDIRSKVMAVFSHGDVDFGDIVALLPKRSLGNPLFDVMLAIENVDPNALRLGGTQVNPEDIRHTTAKFPLTLFVQPYGDAARFRFEFKSALFKQEEIVAMARLFTDLARQSIISVDRSLLNVSKGERPYE